MPRVGRLRIMRRSICIDLGGLFMQGGITASTPAEDIPPTTNVPGAAVVAHCAVVSACVTHIQGGRNRSNVKRETTNKNINTSVSNGSINNHGNINGPFGLVTRRFRSAVQERRGMQRALCLAYLPLRLGPSRPPLQAPEAALVVTRAVRGIIQGMRLRLPRGFVLRARQCSS